MCLNVYIINAYEERPRHNRTNNKYYWDGQQARIGFGPLGTALTLAGYAGDKKMQRY